ncbi:hypothetical protein [Methylosinus sp. R-45379]|uniref:hypothetical protein n=1 Tax=Methylosinus sp. R-45379 TaxID=980563 RepID=UPI0018DD787B|nr:hypothetical protein [Methylosinus sp. R-45379]
MHRPTFDELTAASYDPAQDLRNRHNKAEVSDAPASIRQSAAKPSAYDDASTREKNAKAELAEMELMRRRGELVPVRDIETAAIETATAIAQSIAVFKSKCGRFYAVAVQGGQEALRVEMTSALDETLGQIAEKMAILAARDQDRT